MPTARASSEGVLKVCVMFRRTARRLCRRSWWRRRSGCCCLRQSSPAKSTHVTWTLINANSLITSILKTFPLFHWRMLGARSRLMLKFFICLRGKPLRYPVKEFSYARRDQWWTSVFYQSWVFLRKVLINSLLSAQGMLASALVM